MQLLSLIRPAERNETGAAFCTILLVMTAHALLETARDTLFLTNLPPSRLPWVYLAIAGLALLGGPLVGRSGNERVNRRILMSMQLAAAAGTAAFLPFTAAPRAAVVYVLYLWGGIAAALILVRFWLILGDRLTASQAKRLFPIVAAGAVLGSLCGYGCAGLVAAWHEPRALLFASAAAFLASAGASLLWWRVRAPVEQPTAQPSELRVPSSNTEPRRRVGRWQSFALIARHTYVRRIVLVMLLASVAVTLCDFIFKSVVTHSIASRRIGSFLATVYFTCDLASLALLIGAVAPVVRSVGVPQALAVRPALLLAGATLLTLIGGLPAALMLRGVDGTLRWSLHKTASELLYVPMPARLRSAVKEVSDVVAQRGGQALGSLLILAWLGLSDSERWMGPFLIATAGGWLALAVSLRAPYLSLFRDTLSETLVETRLDFPELDVASLETLMAALNSPDDNRVLAALDLLGATGRVHVVPALILYHPAPPVVVRALELFAGARREDVNLLSGRLLTHGDVAVRAAAMRACASMHSDAENLARAAGSSCAVVSATAMIASAAGGRIDPQAALEQVRRSMGDATSPDLGRCVAEALRSFPVAAFSPLLAELAAAPDVRTRCEAVRAIGELRYLAHLSILIDLLAYRELREAVRAALLAFGEPALAQLQRTLEDFAVPYSVRVHVPRTISRFGHQRAMDLLLRHLLIEPGGLVRYKILRGLGRMCADVPGLRLDAEVVNQVVEDHLTKTFLLVHWRIVLANGAAQQPERRTSGHELLADLLRQKEALAVERLFRILGLSNPDENFAQLYEGLQSENAATRASSRELLAHILPPRWRASVVGLTDDGDDVERLATGHAFYELTPIDYAGLLATLVDHRSDTLAALAAYHARELGLSALATHAKRSIDGREAGRRHHWLALLFAEDDRPAGGLSHAS